MKFVEKFENEFPWDKIISRESISIPNFGMIDCYDYHGHKGVDIQSGKVIYVEPFIGVKFIAHESFNKLLNMKREKFLS